PNVFSPNGDGINDVWQYYRSVSVPGRGCSNWAVKLFPLRKFWLWCWASHQRKHLRAFVGKKITTKARSAQRKDTKMREIPKG
ncbi:MAG: hypothetical protein R6U62_00820, partial [Bacteroidales bacterium]